MKYHAFILLSILSFIWSEELFAQDLWLRSAGGSNLDEATDIVYTPNGDSYYVCGNFSGSANFTVQSINSAGLSDGFIAKYNTDGTPLWVKKIGGSGTDRVLSVTADNSGNAYICGFYQQSASFGTNFLTASDSSEIFVAKISPEGNFLWAKSAGGNGNDLASGIAVDLSLNVIITGNFRGSADFGPYTLSSASYPTSSAPSSDIFTAKLDQNGNWVWVKKGSAGGDEKGQDVCTDGQNNIYICGQYSGDILFDQLHTNTSDNNGFLLKYSASGNEIWFSTISATAVLPYSISHSSDGQICLAGESIGQMLFTASNIVNLPSSYSYNLFLSAYTEDGSVNWANADGSSSYVSARSISTGESGEIYMAGIFECVFSEYSEALSDGLFNSAGFRDVFVSRYENNGTRTWMRQYGGPGEESCGGVSRGSEEDQPRIAGSFERYFHAPGNTSYFQSNTTNYSPSAGSGMENPNGLTSLCDFPEYGAFMHLEAVNNKDIFIGNLFHQDLPHYDYYAREECLLEEVPPCINDAQVPLECNDEITVCGSATLMFVTNTGTENWIGPGYQWQWSNNAFDDFIVVDETGWYWLDVTREDGCTAYRDSIYVTILPLPIPLVSDDAGFNTNAPPDANEIQLCAPDEVTLQGSNNEGLDGWWTDANGNVIEQESITVTTSDILEYHLTASNGCEATNSVSVLMIDPLDEIDPLLQFSAADQPVNDTIVMCGNDFITTELIDLLDQDDFAIYTDAVWQISVDTGYYPPYTGFESYTWSPLQGGWHYIQATPFIFAPEPCSPDTIWYPSQMLSVFIVLLEDPNPQPTISGNDLFCPGDVILLVAENGPNYSWSGPGILEVLSPDSILVNEAGIYFVTSYEAYANGCESTGTYGHVINALPQPQITSNPSHHVICPGESVVLTCQEALSYNWIGPFGASLGSEQSVSVNTSGTYYCVAEIEGCTQESNIIELENYTTPFITTFPANDLCVNGMSSLIIQCSPEASYSWNPPLTGSSNPVTVFDSGEYSASVVFCNITTQVFVTILESNPQANIQADVDYICPGESLTLTANAGDFAFDWSPGNDTTQSIVVTQAGNYQVEITNPAGCSDLSNVFTVDIYDIAPPTTPDQTVCLGSNLSLIANGTGVFWASDPNGNNILSSSSFFSLENIQTDQTVYVFSSDQNCVSQSNEIIISVNPASFAEAIYQDTTFCAGESLSMAASNPDDEIDYLWQLPNGATAAGSSLEIPVLSPEDNGWFILTAFDDQCISTPDSVFILVENPINDALLEDDSAGFCIGSELLLIGPDNYSQHIWITPFEMHNGQIYIIESTVHADEGDYVLIVPGIECVHQYDTIYVYIVDYPEFELSDTSVWCSGGYMTAHVPPGYDAYQWSNGSTIPSAVVPVDGFLSVTVTNLPACSKTDSVQVSDVYCMDEFPNVFTPGGDSFNDNVDFGWLRIPIDKVLIYNRWGNLIREINNSPFIWNGTNANNEPVSEGTYYYVIRSGNPEPWQDQLAGYIQVIFDDGSNE